MKKTIMAGLGLLLSAGLAQAGDYKVLADRQANFSSFKTFKIEQVEIHRTSGAKVKQANHDRLRNAVKAQLVKEGLSEVSSNPDVIVNVVAGIDPQLQTAETQGMPYFDGTWKILPKEMPEGAANQAGNEAKYNQATLRVDIRDAKTKAVVWRAIGEGLVQLPVSDQKVNAALDKAFAQFPPPPAE